MLNSQINKSRASHRLARKELWPDFNLSVEYMFRQAAMTDPGYDMFTVGLTFNLPIQRERRAAMIAESNSEATMSTEENRRKTTSTYTSRQPLATGAVKDWWNCTRAASSPRPSRPWSRP